MKMIEKYSKPVTNQNLRIYQLNAEPVGLNMFGLWN